ncbi:protein BatD [candidate division KSB1 bacterium]|nr:protein BatD [candidate division KSB1 bacterium]
MRAIVFALLLTAAGAFAQYRLAASVDRNPVRVGDALSLTVTFEGASSGVPSPALPTLGKLQVTGGPFSSTNFSMVNGRTSSSIIYTYRLRATAEGHGEIGPVSLVYQGKTFTTNPISVKILAAGAATPPAGGGGADAPGAADNVFIRAIPDKTSLVQGEQVTVSYKIFFNVQMTSPEITQLPRAAGFWVEEIPMPNQLTLTDEMIGGKSYKAAVIRKFAMFATGSGELEIEPMIVTTQVERSRSRGRDPFDIFNDPFFRLGSPREEVKVQSPPVKLKVAPLPDGAPPGFNGAVGSLRISATVDRPATRTNDAVTLTVRLEGTGNIKMLPEPLISFPPDFDRYDPKQSEQINRSGGRIGGAKIFEYVLIPRAPGVQRIPEIAYSYFDPATEKYATIATAAIVLTVDRGDAPGSGTPAQVQRRDVTSVDTDIAFAKTKPGSFHARGSRPHREYNFWLLTGAPWMGLAALHLVLTRRAAALQARPSRVRQIQAAQKQLNLALKAISAKQPLDACRDVSACLDAILAHSGADITESGSPILLRDAWLDKGESPELLSQILDLQRDCNLVRFAVGSADLTTAGQLTERAKQVIAEFSRGAKAKESAA